MDNVTEFPAFLLKASLTQNEGVLVLSDIEATRLERGLTVTNIYFVTFGMTREKYD